MDHTGLQGPLPRVATWGGGSIISGAPWRALCLPNYLQYPLVCAWNPLVVDKTFHSIMRFKVQRPLEKWTVTYIHIQEKVTDDRLFFPWVFIQWKALSSSKWCMQRKRGQALRREGKGEEMSNTAFREKCHLQTMPEPAGRQGCREKKRSHILSLEEDYNQVQLRWKNSRNAWKNGRDAVWSLQRTADKGPHQPWDHSEPQTVPGAPPPGPPHLAKSWTQ